MNLKKVLIAGVVGAVANAVYSILVCSQLIIPYVKKVTPPEKVFKYLLDAATH